MAAGRKRELSRKDNILYAVIMVALSFLVMAILAAVFSIISPGKFVFIFILLSIIFAGHTVVHLIIIILDIIPVDIAYGFSCGLYYGSAILANILIKIFKIQAWPALILSVIISVLVCYIVWLTEFKRRYKDDRH